MSQENVELVRRFYEVLNEGLTSYWSDPEQPFDQTPGVERFSITLTLRPSGLGL
jgi:hypothetical protein